MYLKIIINVFKNNNFYNILIYIKYGKNIYNGKR